MKNSETEKLIQEEAYKRTLTEKLVETKGSPQSNEINSAKIRESIIQIIGKALLEDVSASPVSVVSDCYSNVPERIKSSLELSRSMSDILYRIQDSYSSYSNYSEEVKKILNESYEKVVDICLKKLNETWYDKKEEKAPEEKPAENNVETQKPEEIVSQIMSLITQKEEIISPEHEKYLIESCDNKMSKIRNLTTNKQYSVDNKIVIKWRKR